MAYFLYIFCGEVKNTIHKYGRAKSMEYCINEKKVMRFEGNTRPSVSNNKKHYICLCLLTIFMTYFLFLPQPSQSETLPYPQSPVISGVTWDFSTHIRKAPGSDNWPITWADDDNQYTSWGDGGGFGGTNSDGRVSLGVSRVEGSETSYTSFNVFGGKNPEAPATFQGKSYGLVSIKGTLYMWVMVEGAYFSKSELYFSYDYGVTWTSTGWQFNEPGGAFSVPTILNFGKDYSDARDGFVYIYAPTAKTGSFTSTDGVDLARVPKEQITMRSAYEFFAGFDDGGNPLWTLDISNRKPVFAYQGKIHWTMSVGYNPMLDRYLIFNNSLPNPSQSSSNPGDLEIFDAPNPWGPWTVVASYSNWGNFNYNFSFYLAPKWISTDGKDFTLVFSGTGDNDSWNTVRGTFLLYENTDSIPPASPTGLTVE